MSESDASPWLRAGLIGAAALLLLVGLGWLDASAPDEPRYIQVAEEVRAMENGPGDWVLLHLNGEPYDQKPPFYFWLAAAAGIPTDRVTEFAARLPAAVFGMAAVVGTMLLGRRMFGGRVGVISAALLLTLYEFARLSRRTQLDVPLAALELLALAAFWWLDRGLTSRGRGALLFHAAMGIAALTKGPPGFLIPMLSVTSFLAWEGRLRDLARAFPWWGWLLSLGPILVWYLGAASLAPAGYSDGAVVENVLGRFFSGTSHARPFYYFLYQFPANFLPWTLLWPVVWVIGRSQIFTGYAGNETQRAWRFLIAVVATSFVFFTLSSGKRGLYMVPAFPFAALLCGDAVIRWVHGRARAPRGLTMVAAGVAVIMALLGGEILLATLGMPLVLDRVEGLLEESDLGLLSAFGGTLLVLAAGGAITWVVLVRNRVRVAAFVSVVIGGVFALELAIFTVLYPSIDAMRSPRAIAVAAAAFTEPGEPIGLFRYRSMIGGLAYYGHRPVVELNHQDEVAAFIEGGGQTVVMKRRKLAELDLPLEVVSSSHVGHRELIVVVPAPRAPADVTGGQ
jgi:4-amino-4-deoxy-L-arabinose transferase-like glycosyltransferase